MKKLVNNILIIILLSNIVFADESSQTPLSQTKSTQNSTTVDSATKDSSNDQNNPSTQENTKLKDLFSPAAIVDDTFASFLVGYQALFKDDNKTRQGIFFAIDRGWLLVNNQLILALSLDGSVGGFYSLNLNGKIEGRFLDRLYPSFEIGYGLVNHMEGGVQNNLHGASATMGLFVDIMKGIGLEASYRVGLHQWHTIRRTPIHKMIQSFMLNIKFLDFSL